MIKMFVKVPIGISNKISWFLQHIYDQRIHFSKLEIYVLNWFLKINWHVPYNTRDRNLYTWTHNQLNTRCIICYFCHQPTNMFFHYHGARPLLTEYSKNNRDCLNKIKVRHTNSNLSIFNVPILASHHIAPSFFAVLLNFQRTF